MNLNRLWSLLIAGAISSSSFAGGKPDLSVIVAKADAEKILGVPVKNAKGQNKEGKDGFYDSEWSYDGASEDKTLVLDLVIPGRDAPAHLTETMFSVLPPDGGKATPITGLGRKAIFCYDESELQMLHILVGDALLTIGIHGLPAEAALEQERAIATKILAQL